MADTHKSARHVASLVAVVVIVLATTYVGSRLRSPQASPTPGPSPAQTTVAQTTPTPYLPFDMPTAPTERKVFAHYVPWFPISPDNLPADRDYYTLQYMRPNGENGVHVAYGGYIRDRPMPRRPLDDPDWQFVDIQTEVDQARSIGIDGFAVDIVDLKIYQKCIDNLLRAAQIRGDFTIQITPDMSGRYGDSDEADFAGEFAQILNHPAAHRLDDDRVVLAPFFAERKSPQWWTKVLDILRTTYRTDVAFVPTFLDAHVNLEAFAPISYGFGNWGTRNPDVVNPFDTSPGSPVDLVRRAHRLGKIWMQPVAYQDNRPRNGVYEESQNGVTDRNGWQIATDQQAEWVQLVTWNDYAETTAIAPSVKHGWRMLDRAAHQLSRYKFGFGPTVMRDAVYVSHRTQPFAARPVYPETLLMKNIGGAPSRDTVEVETYARAPSEVIAMIGENSYRCAAPQGYGVCTFPAALGPVRIGMYRDGVAQSDVESPFPVTDSPQVQDLQYVVAGGLR